MRWLAAVAASAAAVQVSGSRTALAVLGAVLIWVALRHPRRLSAIILAAALVGLGAGSLASRIGGGAQESSSSGRLLVVESGGLGARIGVWEAAAKAIVRRPVLGVGPGRFRAATLARRSRAAAKAEGFDHAFVDGHNLLVEYATTTGLTGLACLLLWLVTSVRRGSGPLLAVALALLAAHLLEPQSVSTTPVAFLLLGASSTVHPASVGRAGLGPQVATAVLAALALFGAAHLLIGDWWLAQTHLDRRVSQGRRAVSLLPPWPTPAVELSLSYVFTGQDRHDPSQFVTARHWLRVAVRRDQTDPVLWDALADEELSDGLTQEASGHYRQALRLDPWSVRARNGMGHVEESLGHTSAARQWLDASLGLDPHQPGVVKELTKLNG
jgi:tetratricopeptide (TPR) repeat protein